MDSKYKIKVTKTGIGWKVLLLKKWWFIWFPDTISHIRQGSEHMVDDRINQWVEHFDIPDELVFIPKNKKP